MEKKIKQGDFTELAKSYFNRPGYSKNVLDALVAYEKIGPDSSIADVGSGTGKLAECLLAYPFRSIVCVEPNDSMRGEGEKYISDKRASWAKGSGEKTGLKDGSVDWVTVGSAFHWMETETTLREFHRILKPGGFFTAIWNPRNITGNALHEKIENTIYKMAPFIERKSSGSGKFTENLDEKILKSGLFSDVIYVEEKHDIKMSKERYMGIWDSVNDIPAQAGPKLWKEILKAIEEIVAPLPEISVPYKTRSWTARRK